MKKIGAIVLLCLFAPISTSADSFAETNLQLVDEVIIPSYQRLEEATSELDKSVISLCESPSQDSISKVRDSFHSVMDQWQSVQWLRLGPSENAFRYHRFQIWPDKHNTASKQLLSLLKEQDMSKLENTAFVRSSVAIQGLTALERVLFGDASENRTQPFSGEMFLCHLVGAISNNLKVMSLRLVEEWSDYYRHSIKLPGPDNSFFESNEEVKGHFLKQLIEQLQFISKIKLNRVLDGSRDEMMFRLKRAESWRSGRSLENIRINLMGLREVYEIGFEPHIKSVKVANQLDNHFLQVLGLPISLPDGIELAWQQHSDVLLKWRASIEELAVLFSARLPDEIALPLGFNSLDGD